MDRRAPILAALLLAVSLTGCLSTPEDPPEGEPITAQEAAREAIAWSHGNWAGDAQPVLLSAIEAGPDSRALQETQRDPRAPYRVQVDDDVGDGQAAHWLVMLWSPERGQTRTVTVVGAADVVDHQGAPPMSTPEPLTNWTVDSDEGLQVAMANTSFANLTRADDAELFATLGQRLGVPLWQFFVRSTDEGETRWRYVDARTGEPISDEAATGQTVLHGELGPEAPNRTHALEPPAGHAGMTLGVRLFETHGNATLWVTLEANGTVVGEPRNVTLDNRTVQVVWSGLPPGVDTLHLSLEPAEGGDRASYRISVTHTRS